MVIHPSTNRVCYSATTQMYTDRQIQFSPAMIKTDMSWFLTHDAFVRTNCRAVAMMFIRLSICLGQACIAIIRCTLAGI